MSMHDYRDQVGQTFRDLRATRADLTVQQVAEYIKEKRTIMSSSLWGRYKHRGRHHHLNMFQRAYAVWLLTWMPAY